MLNCFKYIPQSINKLHADILPISAKGSFLFTDKKKYLDLVTHHAGQRSSKCMMQLK